MPLDYDCCEITKPVKARYGQLMITNSTYVLYCYWMTSRVGMLEAGLR